MCATLARTVVLTLKGIKLHAIEILAAVVYEGSAARH